MKSAKGFILVNLFYVYTVKKCIFEGQYKNLGPKYK